MMDMIETLFPIGMDHYVIGGLLVGVGISIPFIFTGLVAGVSTTFTSSWSYLLKGSFFNQQNFVSSRLWRLALVAGLMTGGLIYIVFFNNTSPVVTQVESWRLLLGGIIIGIGTRMSGGCASGHGICGNASLEKVSFLATLIFLTVAVVVAHLVTFIL